MPPPSVAVGAAEGRHVDGVGAAVDRVGPGVARAALELLGLDRLDDLGAARVGLDVDDVHPRRAQPGNEQIATLDVGTRRRGAQSGAARVPAEVVELVADVRHLERGDDVSVLRRLRVEIDHPECVGPVGLAGIDQGHVSQALSRGRLGHSRGGIEGRVRCPACHGSLSVDGSTRDNSGSAPEVWVEISRTLLPASPLRRDSRPFAVNS